MGPIPLVLTHHPLYLPGCEGAEFVHAFGAYVIHVIQKRIVTWRIAGIVRDTSETCLPKFSIQHVRVVCRSVCSVEVLNNGGDTAAIIREDLSKSSLSNAHTHLETLTVDAVTLSEAFTGTRSHRKRVLPRVLQAQPVADLVYRGHLHAQRSARHLFVNISFPFRVLVTVEQQNKREEPIEHSRPKQSSVKRLTI